MCNTEQQKEKIAEWMFQAIREYYMKKCTFPNDKLHHPELAGKPMAVGGDPEARHDFLRQGTALWVYTDSLKEAMASFKYEGCYENAAFFAEEFIRFRKEKLLAWKPDFLIPVPLHRHRRWFRGYNQSEILAEEIGKRLHLPVETDVLCRSLDTSPQKQLDDKARYRNMSSAFYVPESASYKLNGKRVVLIDDIYTTGSTLEACAGELKKAGVSEIYSACLCIGRDY